MRLGIAMALVLLVGCRAVGEDGFRDLPRRWKVEQTLSGDAERGYGAAVAWEGDEIRIGEPWQGPGRLHDEDGVLLTGEEGDRLGEALLWNEQLWIGAPGRGEGGAILRGLTGRVEHTGVPGRELGGALAWHEGSVLGLTTRGFRAGFGSFQLSKRVWSVAVLQPAPAARSTGSEVVLGLASGGFGPYLELESTTVGGTLGRALLACDVDLDGDDDLVAGDPVAGEVRVYVWDGLGPLDPTAPTRTHALGPGAGFALACLRGGVLVGAPHRSGGGGVAWLAEPLTDGDPQWIEGQAGGSLGFALSVGPGRVLAGDPGRGEVVILSVRR